MTARPARLIDSHCHIHDPDYDFLIDQVLTESRQAGLAALIAVGTSYRSSLAAADLASRQADFVFWSLALHPHEAAAGLKALAEPLAALKKLADSGRPNLVAIGEAGLDYYYHQDRTVRRQQQALLVRQLAWARELELPLIFHVRDAWADFWPIYRAAGSPAGVLHSFSDQPRIVDRVLSDHPRLLFGLNGIMTFSQRPQQLAAARIIPDDRLLLETDAPYLTPPPHRGQPNRPAYLVLICRFLANLRNQDPDYLAGVTSDNCQRLFGLKQPAG